MSGNHEELRAVAAQLRTETDLGVACQLAVNAIDQHLAEQEQTCEWRIDEDGNFQCSFDYFSLCTCSTVCNCRMSYDGYLDR